MAMDTMLNARFAIARFAHYLAIEARDLEGLNTSTPKAALRSPTYRVPRTHHGSAQRRANGSLIVLNGWEHPPSLLGRIAATLPAGPAALLYGDDDSWSGAQMEAFRSAVGEARLVRHFAMNVRSSAVALPHVTQVPIGLNGFSIDLLPILTSPEGTLASRTAHRSPVLLCCCQRAWPQRTAAFAALRAAGHSHCNLTQRDTYPSLIRSYLRHRFVVSAHGHGKTDFREWEILAAGAVPVVQRFPEHDALYEGVPIVRVSEWSEVTPRFLDEEWARLQAEAREGHIDWRKIYFPYWFGRFTAHMTPA